MCKMIRKEYPENLRQKKVDLRKLELICVFMSHDWGIHNGDDFGFKY